MMKISGTRTFLEVRVGDRQSVEVVLHVRRGDITWFNENGIFDEMLTLLQTSIIPRKFAQEIETNHYRYESQQSRGRIKHPPEHIGPGGIALCVGTCTVAKQPDKPANGKRRRGPSKTKAAAKKRPERPISVQTRTLRTEREVLYAASATVQLVYKLEEIAPHTSSTLAIGHPMDGTQSARHLNCLALQKLSRRIVLWSYPREFFETIICGNVGTSGEVGDEDEIDPAIAEGFVRPEFIPLASLFAPSIGSLADNRTELHESQVVISVESDFGE
jgi:hypothetical protein